MLPNAHDMPPFLGKGSIVTGIAFSIRCELGFPPFSVRFRCDCVVGATVPKTSVDLDGNPGTRERDVGAACQTFHIHPEAQAASMEFFTNGKLGAGAESPLF